MAMEKAQEMQLAQKLIGMRIRIKEGRERPVDRILKNILLLDVCLASFLKHRSSISL